MDKKKHFPGFQLPTQPGNKASRATQGFFTPVEDLIAQVHSVLPMRVLPIVFIPGIMGSNLRMSAGRQRQMGRENNIAWRPDSLAAANRLLHGTPAMRQTQLDPGSTEVDEYDPIKNPTGNPKETADERHDVVKVKHRVPLGVGINSPLLMDDPISVKHPKTRERALHSTLYSLVQIANKMTWTEQ